MGLGVLGALLAGVMPASAVQQTYVEGVDVSHYQGSPDWAAAKQDGIRFVIAKATEGQTFVDGQYANNMAQADSLAMPFTAYHFARPDTSPIDAVLEADHFLAVAALKGKHLVPVLDLEAAGDLGPRKLRAWAKAWLARVQNVLGVKAMIYTSPSFWKDKMGNSAWFANNGYRLWIAHHGADQPRVPASNWGGRGWTFWQFTDEGSVAGISGNVDRDRYSGTTFGLLKIKNNR